MDLRIRFAVPADAAGIVSILNPIISTGAYTVLDTPFSVEEERAFIERFPERGIFHVATRGVGDPIVGFQTLEPFAAYTRAFDHVAVIGTYVDLGSRRQGIAAALFAATFEAARAKGYSKLFTFVRADNPAALATYQAHGFEVIGTARQHAQVGGRFVDEVLIERFL